MPSVLYVAYFTSSNIQSSIAVQLNNNKVSLVYFTAENTASSPNFNNCGSLDLFDLENDFAQT
jgi:hypothetical protein